MKNKIISIILIIVVGMVAFWYLTKTDSSTSYLAADTKTSNSADAKYIYSMLQQMHQVTLNNNVFSDPTFKNLKDNTAIISSQASGRSNPFSPLGNDANVAGQVTQPTTASSSGVK